MPSGPYSSFDGPDFRIAFTQSWRFIYEEGEPQTAFYCAVSVPSDNSSSSGNALLLKRTELGSLVIDAGAGDPAPSTVSVQIGILTGPAPQVNNGVPESFRLITSYSNLDIGDISGTDAEHDPPESPLPYSVQFPRTLGPNGPPPYFILFSLNEPLTPPLDVTFRCTFAGLFLPNEIFHPCAQIITTVATVINAQLPPE